MPMKVLALVVTIVVALFRTHDTELGMASYETPSRCRGGGVQPGSCRDGQAGQHGFLGAGRRQIRVKVVVQLSPPDLSHRLKQLLARSRAERRVNRLSPDQALAMFAWLIQEEDPPSGACDLLLQRSEGVRADGRNVRQEFGEFGVTSCRHAPSRSY